MRYIVGVFVAIVLAIAVIFALVRGGSDTPKKEATSNKTTLSDYSNKPAVLSFTTTGPVTAEEEREAVKISVSAEARTIEILKGYNKTVAFRQTFPNNTAAYQAFLDALNGAGFSLDKKTDAKQNEICPFGSHYNFELKDGSQQVINTWTTSCGAKTGNFAGKPTDIRKLFQAQIPDYDSLAKNVKL